MRKPLNPVRVVGLVTLIIGLIFSCTNQDSILNQKSKQMSIQAAQENSLMIAAAQDAVNATGSAFVSQGLNYGRIADGAHDGEGDDDDCKPKITNTIKVNRTNPDSVIISGTITIDFDADTTCMRGDDDERRSGKIIDSVLIVLSKTNFKSFESITFQNYWRDSTKIDGSISVEATKGNTVVKINGSKIKYRDGTSSSWTGNLVFTTQRSGTGNSYVSTRTITGSWSGTTRSGTTFSANITKDVVFKASCFGHRHRFTPVGGTIEVTTNGVASTIDYGDGSCDRVYTITTAGTTTEHHLG